MLSFRVAASGIAALLWTVQPASAQARPSENPEPVLVVEGAMAAVSDYRFRGLSLSDGQPALQGELSLSHRSGAYVSAWGSTIAADEGADLEAGFAIGLNKQIGIVQLDGSLSYYAYPGAGEANYFEATGRAAVPLGGGEGGITYAFAPRQKGTGGRANHYVSVDVQFPVGPPSLTVDVRLGLEQGAFGNGKVDWSVGASRQWGPIKIGLHYIDGRGRDPDLHGGAALVASLGIIAE